jgi:hypothetical protein
MRSRPWTRSVLEHRRRQLRHSPGPKSQLDDALTAAYENAGLEDASKTGRSAFPPDRPFDYAVIIERPIGWPGDEA